MAEEAKQSSPIPIVIVNINYHFTHCASHSKHTYTIDVQITEWLQIVKEARSVKESWKAGAGKGIGT